MKRIERISRLRWALPLLLTLLLFSTCKKDCTDDTPSTPCPCAGDACIDEMKAYTYFLPGTWWVYEEQNSGARDSVYVYEAFQGETDEGQRYFTVRMHSTYDEYNYYHEYVESATMNQNYPNCKYNKLTRTKTRPGDFIGSGTVFYFQYFLNDFKFDGGGGVLSVDSVYLDTQSQNSIVYMDIDNCRSESNEHAGFTFQKTFGVNRKYLFEREEVWRLISYHIVQ